MSELSSTSSVASVAWRQEGKSQLINGSHMPAHPPVLGNAPTPTAVREPRSMASMTCSQPATTGAGTPGVVNEHVKHSSSLLFEIKDPQCGLAATCAGCIWICHGGTAAAGHAQHRSRPVSIRLFPPAEPLLQQRR
jgi:hypothetical protein